MAELEKVIKRLEKLREYAELENGKELVVITREDAIEVLEEVKIMDDSMKADDQRDYEAAVEMVEYCERYEPTYNPEDGSM